MATKWAKAVFEIIIAVVIIVFGNKILFGIVPVDAQARSTFSLIVALLWFLVIWCIAAAVVNIIISLRPEPKNSIQSLNKRIDALDEKLVTMGLASEAVPESIPPSPEELKKAKSKKVMMAAAIVATIVVIASIATVVLMSKMNAGSPAGGANPEDTLIALIAKMNARDAAGVVSLTVYSFGNSSVRNQAIQQLGYMFTQAGSSFHVSLLSHQIKDSSELNTSEQAMVASNVSDVQTHLMKSVQDSCLVYYTMNIMMTNGSMEMNDSMVGMKIDNGWYMLLKFEDNGPGDGGNQSSTPGDAFNTFIDRIRNMDATGAVDVTVYKFGDNSMRSQIENNVSKIWEGTSMFQVNVDFMNVIDESDLDPAQQTNLSNIRSNISSKLGLSIQESCFINYKITITIDSGQSEMTGYMPCFRINDGWYLEMDQPEGGEQGISISMSQNSFGNNWTLTVTSVAGANPLFLSDVYLTVINSTATTNISMQPLDMMISGEYMNGVMFNDAPNNGELTLADMFTITMSDYKIGSEFRLTDSSGTQTYYSVTF
jgi:hypothetical protein